MEHLVEWELVGQTALLRGHLPPFHFSTTDPTWSDLKSNPGGHLGSRKLTAWAMTRANQSFLIFLRNLNYYKDIHCEKKKGSIRPFAEIYLQKCEPERCGVIKVYSHYKYLKFPFLKYIKKSLHPLSQSTLVKACFYSINTISDKEEIPRMQAKIFAAHLWIFQFLFPVFFHWSK
jgi:hypothetical protein